MRDCLHAIVNVAKALLMLEIVLWAFARAPNEALGYRAARDALIAMPPLDPALVGSGTLEYAYDTWRDRVREFRVHFDSALRDEPLRTRLRKDGYAGLMLHYASEPAPPRTERLQDLELFARQIEQWVQFWRPDVDTLLEVILGAVPASCVQCTVQLSYPGRLMFGAQASPSARPSAAGKVVFIRHLPPDHDFTAAVWAMIDEAENPTRDLFDNDQVVTRVLSPEAAQQLSMDVHGLATLSQAPALAPVWPEIRTMARDEAVRYLTDETNKHERTVGALGVSISQDLVGYGGSLFLVALLLCLALHARHAIRVSAIDRDALRTYPSALLYRGAAGIVTSAVVAFVLPVLTSVALAARTAPSAHFGLLEVLSVAGVAIAGVCALVPLTTLWRMAAWP